MKNIIEIEELSFSYPQKSIFNNLNLNIKKGSFTTIIGQNGSGKTTLIKLITGQINADTFIMIDNEPIIKESYQLIEKKIAYIPEKITQNFKNTVADELSQINKNHTKILKQLKLENLTETKISKLTTEQKILVEIAKGLLKKPKIFIIDNALDELNHKTKENIIKILKKLNKEGATIIYATNNIDDSLLGDYIIILNDETPIYGDKNVIINNEEIFEYCGLSSPFIVELSQKLKFYNLINQIYSDNEKLVEDLWN